MISNALKVSQAYAAVTAFAEKTPLVKIPSLFLTPSQKKAAYAVHAFFRTADDLIDEQHVTLAQFQAWREAAQQPIEQQTDPFMIAWSDVRREYAIDPAYEQAVLDGLALDLVCHRYETLDELRNYCFGTSTAPGLIAASIVGFRPGISLAQAKPYIENICIAMQLTNIMMDIDEDLKMGRIYLPKAELAAFDLTYEDIEAKRYDRRFIAFMQYFAQVTSEHYAAGWPLLDLWGGSLRLAGGLAFTLYRSFLNEVKARNFDVFQHRVHLPAWKMLWLLFSKWPAIYWTKSADRYFI